MRRLRQRVLQVVLVTGLLAALVTGGATAAAAAIELDTCTAVPDSGPVFDFTQACDVHDACYIEQPYGSQAAGRKQCDVDFYWNMVDSCKADWPRRGHWLQRGACYGVAGVYYLGVRALGGLAWEERESAPLAEIA